MKVATRFAWAVVVALVVGLVASAAQVERWLGVGRPPRLVFDDELPALRPPDSVERIEAAWDLRLRGRGVEVEPGVDPAHLRVAVDGGGTQVEATRALLTRAGQLGFHEVVSDSAVARAWHRRVSAHEVGPEVESHPDTWTNEKNGDVFTDYFLTAATADALDAAITQLAAVEPLPADLRVRYERVVPWHERGEPDRPPYVRTYLVTAEPSLDGHAVEKASITYDQNTLRPEVIVRFTRDGARRFADLTGRIIGHKLAIVLDGFVTSAPIVQTRIAGGVSTITMGGADAQQQEADAVALVNVLRDGAVLPDGLQASLREGRPGSRGLTWLPRLALALLAFVAGFFALGRLALITAPSPIRPIARGSRGVRGVLGAAAVTLGLPLLLAWAPRTGYLMLPGVNSTELGNITTLGLGGSGVLDRMSVFALGVLPIISAFWIVEAVAAVVPRWSKLRLGAADGRRGLDRAALIVGLALAAIQGFFIAQFLASLTGRGTVVFAGDVRNTALVIMTSAAGVAVHVAVADVISRRGLCNGYLALLGVGSIRSVYHLLTSPTPDGSSFVTPAGGPLVLVSGTTHHLAVVACLALIAAVTVAATSVRERTANRSRQPWPCLSTIVGLGQAIGLALVLVMLFAQPIDLPGLWSLASRPLWFDALFAAVATALVVRWQRIPVTRLGAIVAVALLGTCFALRWQAPPALAIGTLILPTIYGTFLLVELALAIRARLGLREPIAIVAVHDVDRADRAADALAAAGIPASVENLRLRAILRGLGGFAPIVVRVAATDVDRAIEAIAAAEAERDPALAAFAT